MSFQMRTTQYFFNPLLVNVCKIWCSSFSGEAEAILATAKAKAEAIERIAVALGKKVMLENLVYN